MTTNAPILKLLGQYPSGAKAWRGWEPKRSGGLRPIAKPNKALNKWLQAMNKELNAHYGQWPEFMHGGIKKRSYVAYARPHVGKACVITVDIRQCFDSISAHQVADSIERHLGLDKQTSLELAGCLCFKGKVAQGFATSNFVCNLYLLQCLSELHAGLTAQGFVFTNYVDDLAVSGVITDPADIINQMALGLSRAGLAINKSRDKICVMPSSGKQIICGLLVNKRLTLTKLKKAELLGAVARGSMSNASADGWVANLKSVDPKFQAKFHAFAVKKRLLK